MWRYSLARLLENSNGNFPFDAGEILEELIEGVPAFEAVEQILHRHSSAGEHRRTALNLRIDRDDSVVHSMTIVRRPQPAVANESS